MDTCVLPHVLCTSQHQDNANGSSNSSAYCSTVLNGHYRYVMSTLALAVILSLGGGLGNLADSGMWQATCLMLQLLNNSSTACLSGSRLQAHLTMLRNLCRYGNASALGPLVLLGRPAACLIMPLMDCS
ncbi:GH14925 [Drosophila grimshawi]|uniref:GH14925 n=1 Tax=Drosophila grimshawi TaxID=7222 RepID=B4J1Q6_DROGR|nr:GH14925 [Drosophila grimshawi]